MAAVAKHASCLSSGDHHQQQMLQTAFDAAVDLCYMTRGALYLSHMASINASFSEAVIKLMQHLQG